MEHLKNASFDEICRNIREMKGIFSFDFVKGILGDDAPREVEMCDISFRSSVDVCQK